jgi:hypothetical protein
MEYLGGDGEWIVCIMCSAKWKYRLFEFQLDAEVWLRDISAKGCGHYGNYNCQVTEVIECGDYLSKFRKRTRTANAVTKEEGKRVGSW